jgi:hypothetical protein
MPGKKPVSHTWRFIVRHKLPFSYQVNQTTGISEAFFFPLAMENFDDKDRRNTVHCPGVCRDTCAFCNCIWIIDAVSGKRRFATDITARSRWLMTLRVRW